MHQIGYSLTMRNVNTIITDNKNKLMIRYSLTMRNVNSGSYIHLESCDQGYSLTMRNVNLLSKNWTLLQLTVIH